MIVSEGSKTEPNYFEEIRADRRLSSSAIKILPSDWGTDPVKIVEYAKHLFENGDSTSNIMRRSFDRVFVVFDRDEHEGYFDALDQVCSFKGWKIKEEDGGDKRTSKARKPKIVHLVAIASVPSFELWLLLHFEDIRHAIERDEVLRCVKGYIPGYEKGGTGYFERTKHLIPTAMTRAEALAANTARSSLPFTDVGKLLNLLMNLGAK